MKKLSLLASIIGLFSVSAMANSYPQHWWEPVPRDQASSWEILPQDAAPGEVILSKRNELGAGFSNLGHTPFTLDGEHYESVEGLWQMMKYPDPTDRQDPRHQITGWPYTRDQVKLLHGFESKNAGSAANQINSDHGIDWINYGKKRFNYVDHAEGSDFHLKLIRRAIKAKLNQNPELMKLLKKTKGLILKPDHHMSASSPKSFLYHELLMEIRDNKGEE
jgi:hypothetical protein